MSKLINDCNLKNCFLCRHSMGGWIPAISAHKKNFTFRKGESIFEEGTTVKGIYFIYKGVVKVHKRWGHEKELILKFAKKGDMIGYRGLTEDKLYPVTATAIETGIVCFIDLSFFEETLKVNHQLTYQLMRFYANEMQEAEKRMRNLAHMDVTGRIAETLLLLKTRFGQTKEGYINILLNRQDIASFAGTTYETLFRVLSDLVAQKIIKTNGKKIFLLKQSKLLELSNDKAI